VTIPIVQIDQLLYKSDQFLYEKEPAPILRDAKEVSLAQPGVMCAGTLVRLTAPTSCPLPGFARPSCEKESTFAGGGLHHPPRCFTRVILQKVTTPSQHVLTAVFIIILLDR